MEYDVLRTGRPQHRMVDGGTGRTDRAETGQWRQEARPLTEPDHGEVREPRPLFGLVHAEPVKSLVNLAGEFRRCPFVVVEDEHPDAARLAVAVLAEHDRPCGGCGGLQLSPDRLDVARGPGAEEGQGDVEVVARNEPMLAGRKERLPGDEAPDHVLGQGKSAKEP
jgi:hypothetical protein